MIERVKDFITVREKLFTIVVIIAAALVTVMGITACSPESEPVVVYVLDENTGNLFTGTADANGIVHIDTTGYSD